MERLWIVLASKRHNLLGTDHVRTVLERFAYRVVLEELHRPIIADAGQWSGHPPASRVRWPPTCHPFAGMGVLANRCDDPGERSPFACPLLPEQVDRGGGEALTERGDGRSGIQDEPEMEAVAQP